jgi:hypothetical protein
MCRKISTASTSTKPAAYFFFSEGCLPHRYGSDDEDKVGLGPMGKRVVIEKSIDFLFHSERSVHLIVHE